MSDYVSLAQLAHKFAKEAGKRDKSNPLFKFEKMEFSNGGGKESVKFRTKLRLFEFSSVFDQNGQPLRSRFDVINPYSNSFLTAEQYAKELEMFSWVADCFALIEGTITEVSIEGDGPAIDEANEMTLIAAFRQVLKK